MDRLLPAQEVYDEGVRLAYLANAAFDRRQAAYKQLRILDLGGQLPNEEVRGSSRNRLAGEARDSDWDYQVWSIAVGRLMGPEVFVDPETAANSPRLSETVSGS